MLYKIVTQFVTVEEFINSFVGVNKLNNFSVKGLKTLYHYLSSKEDDIELDIENICNEWEEFSSISHYHKWWDDSSTTLEDLRTESGRTVLLVKNGTFLIDNV